MRKFEPCKFYDCELKISYYYLFQHILSESSVTERQIPETGISINLYKPIELNIDHTMQ